MITPSISRPYARDHKTMHRQGPVPVQEFPRTTNAYPAPTVFIFPGIRGAPGWRPWVSEGEGPSPFYRSRPKKVKRGRGRVVKDTPDTRLLPKDNR